MKNLLVTVLAFTSVSLYAEEILITNSTFLDYKEVVTSVYSDCNDSLLEIALKNGTVIKTNSTDYGCDKDKKNSVKRALSRIKNNRISFYSEGEKIVCYKTVGIFSDGDLLFDIEIEKCP